jgi:hypothetical protein
MLIRAGLKFRDKNKFLFGIPVNAGTFRALSKSG